MTPLLSAYLTAYSLACIVAVVLLFLERRRLILFQRRYWLCLRSAWKLGTFAVAAIAMTCLAPYTNDPTWDYVDASLMAILTFVTAPWTVGTLYRAWRKRVSPKHVYIAVCVWMFSVSWIYDLYILVRDGHYPSTWFSNLLLSSMLYLAAGLLWNLQRVPARGVVFGFMTPDWPDPRHERGFGSVGWFALPLMILVALLIAPFVMDMIV